MNKLSWTKFCEFAKGVLRKEFVLSLQEQYNELQRAKDELVKMSNQFERQVEESLDEATRDVIKTSVKTYVTAALYATLSSNRNMATKRTQCAEALKDFDRFEINEDEVLPTSLKAMLDKVRTSL